MIHMEVALESAQKRIGNVIRKKRLELGLSQEDLAEECEVHRTYIGSIERGERNISLLNILRVSKALKIKASELLSLAKL